MGSTSSSPDLKTLAAKATSNPDLKVLVAKGTNEVLTKEKQGKTKRRKERRTDLDRDLESVVTGDLEAYRIVGHLQRALFGAVYEAKGLGTHGSFAIKVLQKNEIRKVQSNTSSTIPCEVPLNDIHFADLMRGHRHVMELIEHFEDTKHVYLVFPLARDGDLLEALHHTSNGVDEKSAQSWVSQAASGLAFLQGRRVAMQDVSLENMLLHVDGVGDYQVKICDPGQAVLFSCGEDEIELQVKFHGLVGKCFRPPELYDRSPYLATKVDSWCLGWSTYYLLTAEPLFATSDPAQEDEDYKLFRCGELTPAFQHKCSLCNFAALSFIFSLLQIDPVDRAAVSEAINHPWFADSPVPFVPAPRNRLLKREVSNSSSQRMEQTYLRYASGSGSSSMGSSSASRAPRGLTSASSDTNLSQASQTQRPHSIDSRTSIASSAGQLQSSPSLVPLLPVRYGSDAEPSASRPGCRTSTGPAQLPRLSTNSWSHVTALLSAKKHQAFTPQVAPLQESEPAELDEWEKEFLRRSQGV